MDLSTLRHLVSHENKEIECSCTGLFIDFFGRDNDFGEDSRNEVEGRLGEVLDNDCYRGETVTAGWGGDGRCSGQEQSLKLCITILESEGACSRCGETGQELIGLLLELRIGRLRENEGGEGEKRRKGRAREVYRKGYDQIHEGVACWRHLVDRGLLLLVGLGLTGGFCEGCFKHRCDSLEGLE